MSGVVQRRNESLKGHHYTYLHVYTPSVLSQQQPALSMLNDVHTLLLGLKKQVNKHVPCSKTDKSLFTHISFKFPNKSYFCTEDKNELIAYGYNKGLIN